MRVLAALFLFIAAPIGAQTHCDVHYRWQEKIDATRLTETLTATSVSQMLGWTSPPYTAAETYWCQPRNTREQTVYQLTAWARRLAIQNHGTSADYDWHIELTSSKTMAVINHCIVIDTAHERNARVETPSRSVTLDASDQTLSLFSYLRVVVCDFARSSSVRSPFARRLGEFSQTSGYLRAAPAPRSGDIPALTLEIHRPRRGLCSSYRI